MVKGSKIDSCHDAIFRFMVVNSHWGFSDGVCVCMCDWDPVEGEVAGRAVGSAFPAWTIELPHCCILSW